MTSGHALRHGDWKLIVRKKAKPELYHLADDPFEKKDLASQRSEKVAELEQLLEKQKGLDESKLPPDLAGFPR